MVSRTLCVRGYKSSDRQEEMVNQLPLHAFTLHQIQTMLVLGLRTTCTILLSVTGSLENFPPPGSLCGQTLLESVEDKYYLKNFRIQQHHQLTFAQIVVMYEKRGLE